MGVGAGGDRGGGNFCYATFKFAIGKCIDVDPGVVADLHVEHVIFVHFDDHLNIREISDTHDFGRIKLAGAGDALADFHR